MLKNLSHLVIATDNVAQITHFFSTLFSLPPHFANDEFSEFVLPGRARIAFFKPTGKTKTYFTATSERGTASFGLTVESTEAIYTKATQAGYQTSGPPKTHPWGEKSFLLIDPDGNRWEITQSPTPEGHLVDLDPAN